MIMRGMARRRGFRRKPHAMRISSKWQIVDINNTKLYLHRAAYQYLTETMLVSPENIVLYGRSLGSGPSTYLANKLSAQGVRIGGLVLQVGTLAIVAIFLFLNIFVCMFVYSHVCVHGAWSGSLRCCPSSEWLSTFASLSQETCFPTWTGTSEGFLAE